MRLLLGHWLLRLPRAAPEPRPGTERDAAIGYFWTWLRSGVLLMAGLGLTGVLWFGPALLSAGVHLALLCLTAAACSVARLLWSRTTPSERRCQYVCDLYRLRHRLVPVLAVGVGSLLVVTAQRGNPLGLFGCAAGLSAAAALYLDALHGPASTHRPPGP